MSFKAEIEAIVGSIDNPDYTTQAGLFLTEGVKFITKSLMNVPEMMERLTSTETLTNLAPTLDTSNILKILTVTRYDTDRNREAIRVFSSKKDDYLDINSIYYTSKLDPKYYIENDTLHVIPTPLSDENASVKKIEPDSSVVVTDASIDNLPSELERGVILYASKELLRLFLNSKNATLVALQLDNPSPPSAGSVGDISIGNLPGAPAYNKVSLTLDYTEPGSLGVDDYLAGEDVELANLALSKHQQALTKHGNDIQDELNEFNAQLADFQADVSKLIEQAGLDAQKETLIIQTYQSQVEAYAQEVNEAVQKYQISFQEVVQDYNWYVQQYQICIQDLVAFISQYIPQQPQEMSNEIAANDRSN